MKLALNRLLLVALVTFMAVGAMLPQEAQAFAGYRYTIVCHIPALCVGVPPVHSQTYATLALCIPPRNFAQSLDSPTDRWTVTQCYAV